MKYKLEKSKDLPEWWVLTDLTNLIVIKFKEHEFNNTQQCSVIDEDLVRQKAQNEGADIANFMAAAMNGMADFLTKHYYSIAMPTPTYEYKEDLETGKTLVIRHKSPKFTVVVEDKCDLYKLGEVLKKGGEFLRHINFYNNPIDGDE
jgi:hypothetical protein